jgi:hypothetical protein
MERVVAGCKVHLLGLSATWCRRLWHAIRCGSHSSSLTGHARMKIMQSGWALYFSRSSSALTCHAHMTIMQSGWAPCSHCHEGFSFAILLSLARIILAQ